ncbi:CAP domain-containing protein [Labrys neptuniae]
MSRLRVALAAFLVLGLGGCALTEKPEPVSYQRRAVSFNPAEARDWLTQYRQSKGLTAVALDSRLTAFAQTQANAMAGANQLSHSIGGSFSTRVKSAGLDDSKIGENVSYGTYTDLDAMKQWKNSPQHNENLLMPGATRFGIAIARSGDRVYWAMAVASEPARAEEAQAFGAGPVVRVVRRPTRVTSSGGLLGGLFGN